MAMSTAGGNKILRNLSPERAICKMTLLPEENEGFNEKVIS